MEIVEIADWLKTTIPGIIILGAIGSIVGVFLLWLLYKVSNWILGFSKVFFVKFFWRPLFSIGIIYFKNYCIFRALFMQLNNKKKYTSLILLHQNVTSSKSSSGLAFLVFFISTYMVFLFSGTENLKTAVLFVALTFGFFHDFIMYSVCQNRIEGLLFGGEKAFAENSYAAKDSVQIEILYSISSLIKNEGKDVK